MSQLMGKTALVTGAARGMGRRMAERCIAERVGRIVLWDVDEDGLAAAAAELGGTENGVETAVVDLADVGHIDAAARRLLSRPEGVEILFNNAGIVVGKPFAAHTEADIERTVRINVLGVMHTARAFLPRMIERGRGHIVNIASAVGLTPNPNMSVYAASKWAVLGWSESLRLELERHGRHLRVTTVCPSYVDTGMFEGVRAPWLTPILRPEVMVDRIIRAVKADDILVRAPRIVNLLPVLRGVLPTRVFDRMVGRGLHVYESMDHFTGRPNEP